MNSKQRVWLATLLLLAGVAQAADSWTNRKQNGDLVALTPQYQLQVKQSPRPTEMLWGVIEVPVTPEQLPELHKHRKSPNFPFINVGVEVDKYYRTAQGHIKDDELLVEVDIDRRHWDGLKQGDRLVISLPDGTVLKESLRGSGAALRSIERR
ncbi:MAG: hypothetical protein SV765_16115 [Pseudomonadota bacterium]|nr:hypothetical protein [Pseudomonadales bacterium]MDY6921727.1 hypothetical protein [Pseudomonadota bacterium]